MTPEVFVEVTDTLARPYTAGHQRIVRSLLAGLDELAEDGHPDAVRVVPVVRPPELGDYRRLTPAEADRLRHHPPGGRARRRADGFGPLSPVVRVAADLSVTKRARTAVVGRMRRGALTPEVRALTLGLPPMGSVWLDVEPAWQDPEPRPDLLGRLRASGVHSAVLVVDVIPELHPEWYGPDHRRRHARWLGAHLATSELVLCLSEATRDDLAEVADRMGVRRPPPVVVVPAGTDPLTREPVPVGLPPDVGRYVLVVGTLAPRKNQRLALEAFDRLRRRHDDLALVLVGKEGPAVGDLVEDLRDHPSYGRRLLWLQGIDDAELAWLYRNAYLAVAPSRHEGVGVPVVEALRHGCPVISTGGAVAEGGGGRAEVVAADDADALAVAIERHLLDPSHHRAAVGRAAGFDPPTWLDTATAVAAAVRRLAAEPPPIAPQG